MSIRTGPCLLLLAASASTAVSGEKFTGSEVYLSPTDKDLIVADHHYAEGGSRATRATLYALPLEAGAGTEIQAASRYVWSSDGQRIATHRWGPPDKTQLEASVVLYDRTGQELPFPGFGISPTFLSPDLLLYYSELSDERRATPPRLLTYDIDTGQREVLFEFDAAYTIWPEMVDLAVPPTAPTYHWGGYRGVLYARDDPEDTVTFLVPCNEKKGKLILWQGDHLHSRHKPEEEPLLILR